MDSSYELLKEVDTKDRMFNVFLLVEGTQHLEESVAALVSKLDSWISRDQISAADVGHLVAGLDLLTGKGRSIVTADDFKQYKIHPDIRNLQRLGNVDLNSTIRSQIIKVGQVWGQKISNQVETLTKTEKGRSKIKSVLQQISQRVTTLQSREVKKEGASGPSGGNSLKDRWAMKQEQRMSPGVETTGVNSKPIQGYQRREW